MRCSVTKCGKPAFARGFCQTHYRERLGKNLIKRIKKDTGRAEGTIACSIEGCSNPGHTRGYCQKHYIRLKRHGDPTYNKTEAQLAFIEQAIDYNGNKCLLWPFKSTKGQYPAATIGGEQRYVHRYVCERVYGLAPPQKPWALHSCDKQFCIAPKHLRWGTDQENVDDMMKRGRSGRNQFSKV